MLSSLGLGVAQQLRTLVAVSEDSGLTPSNHSVTQLQFPVYQTPFFDLRGHQAWVGCTYKQAKRSYTVKQM